MQISSFDIFRLSVPEWDTFSETEEVNKNSPKEKVSLSFPVWHLHGLLLCHVVNVYFG
jgi:hypothetical protein